MNVPIIRLEVTGMKTAVRVALMAHAAQMDADIQAAVDAYCTPENMGAIVRKTAREAIDLAVKEEVRSHCTA